MQSLRLDKFPTILCFIDGLMVERINGYDEKEDLVQRFFDCGVLKDKNGDKKKKFFEDRPGYEEVEESILLD